MQNCPLCDARLINRDNNYDDYCYCFCGKNNDYVTVILSKKRGDIYIKLSNFDKSNLRKFDFPDKSYYLFISKLESRIEIWHHKIGGMIVNIKDSCDNMNLLQIVNYAKELLIFL